MTPFAVLQSLLTRRPSRRELALQRAVDSGTTAFRAMYERARAAEVARDAARVEIARLAGLVDEARGFVPVLCEHAPQQPDLVTAQKEGVVWMARTEVAP